MKTLTRQDVIKSFHEITNKYESKEKIKGIKGIFCEEQFISSIVNVLSAYDECNIIFENGCWDISPDLSLKESYANDYTFVGTVIANEWFTQEQLKALHELSFGYQF